MSGLLNDFTTETRALFLFNYRCFECSHSFPQDNGLTLHHIYKRSSRSPLNACPICSTCHDLPDIHSKEKRAKYINLTLKYLQRQDYIMTEKDFNFLKQIE